MARMLHDSPSSKGNSQVTCTIDVLRNKNPSFITVDPDKIVSPLGPVIHEVTEFEHEHDEISNSPAVASPEEKSSENAERLPENEMPECPISSCLNSPIDTSASMEPLSILESLQPSTPLLNVDDCCLEESVLGLPFECISDPTVSVISLCDRPSNNVISLPDTTDVGLSYDIVSPDIIAYGSENSTSYDSMSESLLTPKIPTIHIEDVYSVKQDSKQQNDILQQSKTKSNVDSEHNYQLALADSSSIVKPSTFTKNHLSNHLLNVEEGLNYLQEKITGKPFDIDANVLLGLFSTDDTVNNEALAGEFAAQANIKIEPNDIVGNELVQFTPSMLDIDFDSGNNQFFACLDQDVMSTEADNKNTSDQKNDLLVDVLNTDQAAASKAAEYLLSSGSSPKHKAQRRTKTTQKLERVKRRKIK